MAEALATMAPMRGQSPLLLRLPASPAARSTLTLRRSVDFLATWPLSWTAAEGPATISFRHIMPTPACRFRVTGLPSSRVGARKFCICAINQVTLLELTIRPDLWSLPIQHLCMVGLLNQAGRSQQAQEP